VSLQSARLITIKSAACNSGGDNGGGGGRESPGRY